MGEKKEKTVVCCDGEEIKLAATLKTFIEETFNSSVKICDCPKDFPINAASSGTKFWEEYFIGTSYVFILCSPYSIGQQGINFISGVAVRYVTEREREQNPPRIVPVCHSGQKARDLPHYLYSRQILDIGSDNFLDGLFSILSSGEFGPSDFRPEDFTLEDSADTLTQKMGLERKNDETAIACLNRILSDQNFKNNKPRCQTDQEFKPLCEKYDKTKHVVILKEINRQLIDLERNNKSRKTRAQIEETLNATITSMTTPCGENIGGDTYGHIRHHDFLRDSTMTTIRSEVSIGRQYCLFDGKDIYVGLKISAKVDTNFKSFCKPLGPFEPGYDTLHQIPIELKNVHASLPGIAKRYRVMPVTPATPVYGIMQQRATAMGIKLWHIEGITDERGQPEVCTVLVNWSLSEPKFEIGVWTYIDVSVPGNSTTINEQSLQPLQHLRISPSGEPTNVKTIELKTPGTLDRTDSAESSEEHLTPVSYWIWVKDGEIGYWYYPDYDHIPRYIDPASTPTDLFIPTKKPDSNNTDIHVNILDYYGRPEIYTPFAADDVLEVGKMVKEPFAFAARALLSIF